MRFIKVLPALLAVVGLAVAVEMGHAGWDSPHPVLDKENSEYRAPVSLSSISLEELIKHRDFYQGESVRLRRVVSKKADQEALLQALLAYDLKRVKIAAIIPDMIKAYQIEPPLSEQLLTYAATIQQIYDEHRATIKSLDAYRPYDFRLGIAYTSMMTVIMTEDETLYSRMRADMEKPETVIGGYINELDVAYQGVEKVNEEIEEFHLLRQVEKELGRISSELSQR